jgi:hypothetical protein
MVRAYPVLPAVLRQLTRAVESRQYENYNHDSTKDADGHATYIKSSLFAKQKSIVANLNRNQFSFDDNKKTSPVWNQDYVSAQIRHDLHVSEPIKPDKRLRDTPSPPSSGNSSPRSKGSKDTESTPSTPRSRSSSIHEGSTVQGSSRSFFEQYHGKVSIEEAMKSLHWISLFVDTDKENYCLFQNALPIVIKQTEKWIEKQRDGCFGSFQKSTKYVLENAKTFQMVPFWKNLYYQFGLLTVSLESSMRPSSVREWNYLYECCKKICAAAQRRLYPKYEVWSESYEKDLEEYQSTYNKTHGSLRWFEDVNNNYLHLSIHRLNTILTMWATSNYDRHPVETRLLHKVFEIENLENKDAIAFVEKLNTAKDDDHPDYKNMLKEVLEWNWYVQDGSEQIYNNIYREALKLCVEKRIEPQMMYIEAVEHYRTYDTTLGPSVFWSGRR